MRKTGYTVLCLFLCGGPFLHTVVQAQERVDSTRAGSRDTFEPGFTLENWGEKQRLLVLDRMGNFGDRLYDRGTFRHVTPGMDREYALDMLLYRHSAGEGVSRTRAENSLSLRLGSVGRDLFAFVSHINSQIPIRPDHTLALDAVLQQDAQATRSFLELGYVWAFGGSHSVGVRHTVSEYKPDLDITALYTYTDPALGTAELGLTLQNAYNDFIYQQLGITAVDREIIRSYSRHPYLLSFSYASPAHYAFRTEIVYGLQPRARVLHTSQTAPEYRYREDERLHYLGALVEYRTRTLAGGLFYKRDESWLRRAGTGNEVTSDYTSRQEFSRLGAYLRGRWRRLEGRVRVFTGSYRDQQEGDDFAQSLITQSVDYDEAQRGLQARLLYDSTPGLVTGLEYLALQRSYDDNISVLARNWTRQWWVLGPSNYRVVGLVGYQFRQGRIIVGVGYDLDGDPVAHENLAPRRFDNGFGRLTLTW